MPSGVWNGNLPILITTLNPLGHSQSNVYCKLDSVNSLIVWYFGNAGNCIDKTWEKNLLLAICGYLPKKNNTFSRGAWEDTGILFLALSSYVCPQVV